MIPSLMALLHLGCTPLSKCTPQGHPTNIIANQMLLSRHPTFCPMWKDRGWITASLKSILLSGNLNGLHLCQNSCRQGKTLGKDHFSPKSNLQESKKEDVLHRLLRPIHQDIHRLVKIKVFPISPQELAMIVGRSCPVPIITRDMWPIVSKHS